MVLRIFRAVFFLSCVGSGLALVLAALRPLGRRYFSAGWNYYCWLAVLLAMLLPVGWPATGQAAPRASARPGAVDFAQEDLAGQAAPARTLVCQSQGRGAAVLAGIWLAGACLLLALKLASYARLLHRIRRYTRPVDCPQLAASAGRRAAARVGTLSGAPMVVGLFRPTLLLPEGVGGEQLHYILLHEALHIRRHDLLVKWLAAAVRCIHWFNPLAHWVARQIEQECEISCDLAVVSRLDSREEQAYKRTLLELSSRNITKSIVISAGMAGRKSAIERRLMRMKNRKPIGRAASALSACLAALLLCTTLCASGALAARTGLYASTADAVLRDGAALDYAHQPFVEGGVRYVPLREALGHFVDFTQPLADLSWAGDGHVVLDLFDPASVRQVEDGRAVYALLYHYELVIGEAVSYSGGKVDFALSAPPLLKEGVTYVPIDFLQRVQEESGLLHGFSVK